MLESAEPRGANFALRGRMLAKLAKARRLVAEGIFEPVGGVLYLDQHRSVHLGVPSVRTASEDDLREGAGGRDVRWLGLRRQREVELVHLRRGPAEVARADRLERYASAGFLLGQATRHRLASAVPTDLHQRRPWPSPRPTL